MRAELVPLPPHVMRKVSPELRARLEREWHRVASAARFLDEAIEGLNAIIADTIVIAEKLPEPDPIAHGDEHGHGDIVH